MKGAISFWPTLMLPLGFANGAADVGLGVETGTEVAAGAVVAAGLAGAVVAAGALVAAGAEVAAGAVVGGGVAVAAEPQATMKSRSRITEVNIIHLELFSQRLRIIRPPRFKNIGEPGPSFTAGDDHRLPALISSPAERITS
jgi:hypothetical protein